MAQHNWTRWGLPRTQPGQPGPLGSDHHRPADGPAISAPAIETLMPLQPLTTVLSTAHLQRRGSPARALVSAAMGFSTGQKISGLALPFEKPYSVGAFNELIRHDAFTESLRRDDPRLVFNFDPGRILGRVSANTLRVWEGPDSLEFDDDVPDTMWARDLLVSMRRGDISNSCAQFYIERNSWQLIAGVHTRVIEKAALVAISIAAFGELGQANADTEEKIAEARKLGRMEGQFAAASSATVQ